MSDDKLVTVKFELLDSNYERLWTTAALQGASRTETLNRAVEFYDAVHRLEPPEVTGRFLRRTRLQTMSWEDVDGVRRRIARIE